MFSLSRSTRLVTLSLLSAAVCVATSCGFDARQSPTAAVKDFGDFSAEQRLEDFKYITAIFDEYYAPLEYKQQKFGFNWANLKQEYEKKVSAAGVTRSQYVALVQEFVAQLRDAHTQAYAFRDALANGLQQIATLGFTLERTVVDGKGVGVVKNVLRGANLPNLIKEDDQILAINGIDLDVLARNEVVRYHNYGNEDTNLTIAYAMLATRDNIFFASLPKGTVEITLKRNGAVSKVKTTWIQIGNIFDYLLLLLGGGFEDAQTKTALADARTEIVKVNANGSIQTRTDHTRTSLESLIKAERVPPALKNEFLFNKDIYLRNLLSGASKKESTSDGTQQPSVEIDGFSFQLAQTEKGPAAIYKVEDFMYSRLRCKEFYREDSFSMSECVPLKGEDYANAFSKLKTLGVKNLILDTRSNPGGALDWGYELARAFTRDSMDANLAGVRVTEEWYGSFKLMAQMPFIPATVREQYKENLSILDADIAAHKRLSTPLAITGQKQLAGVANPWDGKTYVLTDELCASMCDIFATLLQDHKLAKVIGKQSVGAGGNVELGGISPHSKIVLSQTMSLIYRLDGRIIENEGVTPDIVIDNPRSSDFMKKVVEVINKAE